MELVSDLEQTITLDNLTSKQMVMIYSNLGNLLRDLGHAHRSAAVLEEVYTWRRLRLGETHPQTLRTRCSLAETFQAMGHFEEAEAMFCAILRLAEEKQNPDAPAFRRYLRRLRKTMVDHQVTYTMLDHCP